MGKGKPRRRIERRELSKLHPHPRQAELFGDLSDAELGELAADIKRNRLVHPVEILPDGTIIAGHQRVRAARKLGWTEIRCWVRDDLQEAGTKVVETRLIEDNFHRRQLGFIAQIRCYVRLKELQQNGRSTRNCSAGDVRDQLAKRFGKSGRTLDRWARILNAPVEVQQAVDSGSLDIVAASKVPGLDKDTQRRIAERIREGDDANDVVKEALRANKQPGSSIWAVKSLLRSLRRGVEKLRDCRDFDLRFVPEDDLAWLPDGRKLIDRLLKEKEKVDGEETTPADVRAGAAGQALSRVNRKGRVKRKLAPGSDEETQAA